MPRKGFFQRKPPRLFSDTPERPPQRRAPTTASPAQPSGRYDAAGDPVLTHPAIVLETPFSFGGELAQQLLRREVNVKEAFTIRDASGVFFRASLKELSGAGGSALPYEKMAASPEPSIDITLACAVLARQRMIFVAQKATELGVSRIIPLLTEHSVPEGGLEHEKAHAWPGQIIRAAKQCRRGSLPELSAPTTLEAFLSSPQSSADLSLCLDNIGGEPAAGVKTPKKVLLLVGPEGGFSPSEREKLAGRAANWNLGGRVLRAETAVIVGLTAVQLSWGDFRAG